MAKQPKTTRIKFGGHNFRSKRTILIHLRMMVNHYYNTGASIEGRDHDLLMALIARHPDAARKMGVGVDHFTVVGGEGENGPWYSFAAVWVDGHTETFSFTKCWRRVR